MAFTRQALFIAAPGVGVHYSQGTLVDIVEWQRYLTSNAGGAWNDDELMPPLIHPSKDQLQEAISTADGCDYAIVTFSGHGHMEIFDDQPTTMLKIAPSLPSIPYFELKPRCARTLLVIDSCRWDPTGRLGFRKMAEELVEKSLEEQVTRQMHRDLYQKLILATERGTIRLFGCDCGEEAEDNISETEFAGLYTHHLIKAGKDWYATAAGVVLNVFDAHAKAARNTTHQNDEQHPKIIHGRRLGIFPFAVKA